MPSRHIELELDAMAFAHFAKRDSHARHDPGHRRTATSAADGDVDEAEGSRPLGDLRAHLERLEPMTHAKRAHGGKASAELQRMTRSVPPGPDRTRSLC